MILGVLRVFKDNKIYQDLMHFAKMTAGLTEDEMGVFRIGMIYNAWLKFLDYIDFELYEEWWRQHDQALNDAQKAAMYEPEES